MSCKCSISNGLIIVEVGCVCCFGIWKFSIGNFLRDFHFSLFLKLLNQIDKELMSIVLLGGVEFVLKVDGIIIDFDGFLVVEQFFHEFEHQHWDRFFFVLVGFQKHSKYFYMLLFEKIVVHLVNRKQTLKNWNHETEIERIFHSNVAYLLPFVE